MLAKLRPEFPDVTISKIRFLEAEGLVEPQRTSSGYRKFGHDEIERLRYVLAAQRDRYLPLKVIKDHLDAMDRGLEPPDGPGVGPRVPMSVVATDGFPTAESFARDASELRLSRAELLEAAGLDEDAAGAAGELRPAGPKPGSSHYDGDALVVAKTVAEMAGFGLEARHLRAFRSAADREVGLVEQVVAPLANQRNPEAATARRRGRPRAVRALRPAARRPGEGRARSRPDGAEPASVCKVVVVQPLDVVGVRVEMPSNQPIVLLREIAGERYLPDLDRRRRGHRDRLRPAGRRAGPPDDPRPDPRRPRRARAELSQIRITELRDGVFYAQLVFATGVEVSARPSDAIALALRTGTPIFGAEDVLDEAGHRDPGRAGGRGRAVHRVPRPDLARRTSAPGRASPSARSNRGS